MFDVFLLLKPLTFPSDRRAGRPAIYSRLDECTCRSLPPEINHDRIHQSSNRTKASVKSVIFVYYQKSGLWYLIITKKVMVIFLSSKQIFRFMPCYDVVLSLYYISNLIKLMFFQPVFDVHCAFDHWWILTVHRPRDGDVSRRHFTHTQMEDSTEDQANTHDTERKYLKKMEISLLIFIIQMRKLRNVFIVFIH